MKKVKLPKGMRYYKNNGVEDLTRVEIRYMKNYKSKSKLVNFDGSVKNLNLIKSQLETEMSKSDYIDPARMNLNQLLDKYISTKLKKESTQISQKNNYLQFVKRSNNISSIRIDKIKM